MKVIKREKRRRLKIKLEQQVKLNLLKIQSLYGLVGFKVVSDFLESL